MMVLRIGIRMERRGLIWGGAVAAALAVGMVVTVAGMASVVGGTGCDADFILPGCGPLVWAFAPWERAAQNLIDLLWVLPLGMGALLGVGITAGEIEHRTAPISWSLSVRRIRWLMVRSLPVALALVVVLSVAAGFAELAERGRLVTDQPGFYDHQLRTMIVPARGLLAFAIGLAVGAAIGRTLPALLVALGFGTAITVGIGLLVDTWQVMAATVVPAGEMLHEPWLNYPLVAGSHSAFQGPEGASFWVIPTSEFWFWVPVEAGVFLVAAVAIWALAAGFVERRSP